MKKYIAPICWLIGAVVWFLTAFTYLIEGKKVFEIMQFILSMLFMAKFFLTKQYNSVIIYNITLLYRRGLFERREDNS